VIDPFFHCVAPGFGVRCVIGYLNDRERWPVKIPIYGLVVITKVHVRRFPMQLLKNA
jgi:hypothetical protein